MAPYCWMLFLKNDHNLPAEELRKLVKIRLHLSAPTIYLSVINEDPPVLLLKSDVKGSLERDMQNASIIDKWYTGTRYDRSEDNTYYHASTEELHEEENPDRAGPSSAAIQSEPQMQDDDPSVATPNTIRSRALQQRFEELFVNQPCSAHHEVCPDGQEGLNATSPRSILHFATGGQQTSAGQDSAHHGHHAYVSEQNTFSPPSNGGEGENGNHNGDEWEITTEWVSGEELQTREDLFETSAETASGGQDEYGYEGETSRAVGADYGYRMLAGCDCLNDLDDGANTMRFYGSEDGLYDEESQQANHERLCRNINAMITRWSRRDRPSRNRTGEQE